MFLYVLTSRKLKKLYIGTTDNIKRRLKEHNTNHMHYTGRINDEWDILGFKEFSDSKIARKEEIRLKKSKNRKYIEWYILNKGA